jgi:hypothetical protein
MDIKTALEKYKIIGSNFNPDDDWSNMQILSRNNIYILCKLVLSKNY